MIEEQGILAILSPHDIDLSSYEGSELFGLNKNYVAIFDRVIREGQAQGKISPELTVWVLRDIFFGSLDYGSRTILIKGRESKIGEFVDHVIGLIVPREPVGGQSHIACVTQRLEHAADRMEALMEGQKYD